MGPTPPDAIAVRLLSPTGNAAGRDALRIRLPRTSPFLEDIDAAPVEAPSVVLSRSIREAREIGRKRPNADHTGCRGSLMIGGGAVTLSFGIYPTTSDLEIARTGECSNEITFTLLRRSLADSRGLATVMIDERCE